MRDISRKEYVILDNVTTISKMKKTVCEVYPEFNAFPFHIVVNGKVIHNMEEKISPEKEYMLMPLFIGG